MRTLIRSFSADTGKPTRTTLLLICAVALLVLSSKTADLITTAVNRRIATPENSNPLAVLRQRQDSQSDKNAVLYRFGFDDTQGQLIRLARDITIETEGLFPAVPWLDYPYPWHFSGQRYASVTVSFPPGSLQEIALFFADGDGEWRIVRVQTHSLDEIVNRLYQGRWLSIPLSAEEKSNGRCRIRLESLMGPGVAVSAISLN